MQIHKSLNRICFEILEKYKNVQFLLKIALFPGFWAPSPISDRFLIFNSLFFQISSENINIFNLHFSIIFLIISQVSKIFVQIHLKFEGFTPVFPA